MDKVLEVKNLNKSFGSFRLKDIGFSLESDCITGFVGANGAGKTTTIKLLLDLIKRDSGEIRYFNDDFDVSSNRVKNRIGFVLDVNGPGGQSWQQSSAHHRRRLPIC
jgi:ABC-2 type transport system ATP-binding protein